MIWRAESASIVAENPKFRRRLPLSETSLLRTLHKRAGRDCTEKAAEEVVAIEESGVDRNDEPTLEGYRTRSSLRIVRDVSVRAGLAYSLDMTKDECSRW